MKRLAIIGASGHGKVVADIAAKTEYEEIVFLDDNEFVKECSGYPVIGKSNAANELNYDVVVAIGNVVIRQRIQENLEKSGVKIATLIHPNAVIAEDVVIGKGTVIMAGSVINPGSIIGKGCIINTCSSIDHDCKIGDYVHISVGSHLAGTVIVDNRTWIGVGATISNNVDITSDCMIGAGALVINNIEETGTYVGVPVRKMDMEQKSVKNLGGVFHPTKKIEYVALPMCVA